MKRAIGLRATAKSTFLTFRRTPCPARDTLRSRPRGDFRAAYSNRGVTGLRSPDLLSHPLLKAAAICRPVRRLTVPLGARCAVTRLLSHRQQLMMIADRATHHVSAGGAGVPSPDFFRCQ
jgi:hypothetical protein